MTVAALCGLGIIAPHASAKRQARPPLTHRKNVLSLTFFGSGFGPVLCGASELGEESPFIFIYHLKNTCFPDVIHKEILCFFIIYPSFAMKSFYLTIY